MPRPHPDTPQIKPFELRVGVGGMPVLGGIYRAGDPATIPPNKFHMLVNVRITPSGMRERPGMALEFDTGVEECIDGLTEDGDGQGAGLLLYPGAAERAGNGTGGVNPATFRAIFPDSSRDYSEYVFALYGPASQAEDTSVILVLESTKIVVRSRPFLFRGQACAFAEATLNGSVVVALMGMNLAGRSFKAADDCVRSVGLATGSVVCSAIQGGPNRGELWPFQWPVGSAAVIINFDNPFGNTTFWWPDSTTGSSGVVDQILALPERVDNPITDDAGVSEVLYFIAQQDNSGDIERLLVRWDGSGQTNEDVAIPDNLQVALGKQTYGPYLVSGGANGSAEDWAAVRDADGNWDLIGGVGWVVGAGVGEYGALPELLPRGLTWGGLGQVVSFGLFNDTGPTTKPYIFCHPQGATEFEAAPADRSCTLYIGDASDPAVRHVLDAIVSGTRCYAIGIPLGSGPQENQRRLFVGDFSTPLVVAAGSDRQLSAYLGGPGDLNYPELWIQAVGDRVYVGGHFFGWDPAVDNVDADHHGVYDVTDPQSISVVYRVYDTEQPNDAILEGSVDERLSRGALPAVPNDDRGGQGFQGN